jgi:hypothetical protein
LKPSELSVAYFFLCASAMLCSICIRLTNIDLIVKVFVFFVSFMLTTCVSAYETFLLKCDAERFKAKVFGEHSN